MEGPFWNYLQCFYLNVLNKLWYVSSIYKLIIPDSGIKTAAADNLHVLIYIKCTACLWNFVHAYRITHELPPGYVASFERSFAPHSLHLLYKKRHTWHAYITCTYKKKIYIYYIQYLIYVVTCP